ncbi:MAG: hypothetical protein Q4B54_00585 [Coriobacteriales bacterium]|nr:hypothetical protein [Coriobacteriales bacterium]
MSAANMHVLRQRKIWVSLLLALIATLVATPALAEETAPMYRLYNPNSGEHFYTANANERNLLIQVGWYYEGLGWMAPASSNVMVYRLYNSNAGDHHYTTSVGERDLLMAAGWSYEGVGWFSDPNATVSVYRQYNPNALSGAHNFTSSKGENDALVAAGWRAEGIAWYGVAMDAIEAKYEYIMGGLVTQAMKRSPDPGDMLSYIAEQVHSYAEKGTFTTNGVYYNTAMGPLVYGQYSCAGTAAACVEILSRLGYAATQINAGRNAHNWCEVTIDGTTWIVEGEAGFAARKSDTVNYPNGRVSTYRGEVFTFQAAA